MTPRERRLERRLCERERELIRAETDRAFYFGRWMLATRLVPGLARMTAEVDEMQRRNRRGAA